jgi:hypothetical protein
MVQLRPATTGLALAAAVLVPSAALALSRRDFACQAAIARAGRAYVAAELASRARCAMRTALGRDCDPDEPTSAHEARLRRMLRPCTGAALGRLAPGGCAEEAGRGGVDALAACLLATHDQAVETLLGQQLGGTAETLPAPTR